MRLACCGLSQAGGNQSTELSISSKGGSCHDGANLILHHSMSAKIVLRIRGLSHVPSMKNSKMLTRGKLITKPEYQKWMERCIQSFESELRYLCRTKRDVTETEPPQLCSIASLNQFDDSVHWIPEIDIRVQTVPKGEDGAIITLEQLE